MPVAMISTSTSPCFGPSRSTSTISSGCLGAKATAARVFMVSSPLESGAALCLEEPPYPTGNARIVVGRIEGGDRRLWVGHDVVALLDQRLGERGREFRMELEADRRPVGPGERGERREVRRRHDFAVWRLNHDLVLVRGGNRDGAGRIDPRFGSHDGVTVKPRAPALVRLLDLPAERFGHHLVPEADANHLRMARIADELLERRD